MRSLFQKLFALACLALMAFSCSKQKEPPVRAKPLILVSIAPYRFFVERIAGSGFEVQTIVPAASNPHSFEPTSAQVAQMNRGQLWFRIGEPFEEKIVPILKTRNPYLVVADLREGIQLIEEAQGLHCKHCSMDHLDRHIWLSPILAIQQAALIEKALSAQFPEHQELFAKNFEELSEDLVRLDLEIQEILKPVEKRVLLVSHPAFGYFCKDYHFTQLSIEYEGKDPRPKHLEEVLKQAVAESAQLALALPQYNNKGAQRVAEKLHKPVCLIDPYSADYFQTLRKLAHLIANPYAD